MNAAFSHPLDSGKVQCRLCSQFCLIAPGERGICGVRACTDKGNGPELETLVADGIAAWHVDPVEKKPLYHYLPGTLTFSFGTVGCNFDCAWCQNDTISREPAETGRIRSTPATPENLAQAAFDHGCASMAFTYTEPTIFYELLAPTADLALRRGLGTILVSNGFQSPDSLNALRGRIQAANIDLKAFRDESYRRWCGGRLQPVLDNLKRMKEFGWWLEVTTLVVPGVNDHPDELRDIARFIRHELDARTPWHISAFHPCRRMTATPPTPASTLAMAVDIGREEGLAFVYVGNSLGQDRATCCPFCGQELMKRQGFRATPAAGFSVDEGICPQCGEKTPGIWSLT